MARDPTPLDAGPQVTAQPGIWRFGDVVVDEREASLTVAGAPVDLDRSSYDVLLCLLRHVGEVVGKDELLDAGWPGRVVSENSLAKAVSRLRHALGSEGGSLKVVHGYGYRLAAGVRYEAVPLGKVHAHPHEADRLRPGDPVPHRPGWRLRQRLGEGSAGIIYLAEDAQGHSLAVKLATSEAGLRSLKREIALERYIVAMGADIDGLARLSGWNLNHPPYFAEMPYFAGGNLRDWLAARGGWEDLGMETRLAMLAGLCDTLAGLHGLGIIHKDLKPENLYPVETPPHSGNWRLVLSDLGAGQAAITPRLAELDMGLSIIDPVQGSASGQAGNLLYMAPEVIAGDIPTQRSDVFALGVLLYQLVVGDLRRSLAPGWEHDVHEPLLREDIADAAAANPQRRLLDPAELGTRLRSLGARREAREADIGRQEAARLQLRQLGQLQRRRKFWVAGSVTLAAFLAMSLWQQQATRRERTIANLATAHAKAQAAKTEAVVDFLTEGILRQANPNEEARKPVSLREAVDRAAGDIDARFGDNPDVAAAVHGALAAAYEGMNDFDAAVAHFKKQVRGLRTAKPVDRPALARAQARLCTAWHWQGDLRRARAACELARADYLAAGLEPDHPEVFLALGDSRRDQHREVLRRLEPRMARIRRSGDHELMGYALWFYGGAQNRLGHLEGVERTFSELVEVRKRQFGKDSMLLAWALADHGKALLQVGRIAEGRESLRRAQSMFDRTAGEDHPQSRAPSIHLAAHAYATGQWEEARALARPSYRFLLAKVGWEHWTSYAALTTLGAEARLGNHAEARRMMDEFSAMAAEGLEEQWPYLREPYWTQFLEAHLALGEPGQAQVYLRKLQALARDPESSILLAGRLECYRGALLRAQGATEQGREQLASCQRRLQAQVPAGSPVLGLPARLGADVGRQRASPTPARRESVSSPAARSRP